MNPIKESSAEDMNKMLLERKEILSAMALKNLKKRLLKRVKKGDENLKSYIKNIGSKKPELPPRFITAPAKK